MKLIAEALVRSVESVSAGGTLFYTLRQLYYEINRTLRPRFLSRLGKRIPFAAAPILSYLRYLREIDSYAAKNGPPPGLIPAEQGQPLPLAGREPDLADYGVPRLLICQHDDIARMLIANYVHMELSVAVLGLTAATPLPDPVCAILVLAGGASVYLLHDAGREGLALIDTLPARVGLPEGLSVTSVGLRPAQCLALGIESTRSRVNSKARAAYSSDVSRAERAWLNVGWMWEVSAARPVDLMHLLHRVMVLGGDSP